MRDTEKRGRDIGRERSRLPAGNLMQDSIPGLGSRPEPKADAQLLSHPGVPRGSNLNIGPPSGCVTLERNWTSFNLISHLWNGNNSATFSWSLWEVKEIIYVKCLAKGGAPYINLAWWRYLLILAKFFAQGINPKHRTQFSQIFFSKNP